VSLKRIIFTVTNDLTYDQRMQRICTTMAGAGYKVLLVGRKLRSSVALRNEPFPAAPDASFICEGKALLFRV
jgi:hypothetical protein